MGLHLLLSQKVHGLVQLKAQVSAESWKSNKGHLNDSVDDSTAPHTASTGQFKKPGSGLGLCELLAATQTHHLRLKQLASAAAKVHGIL